jgi:uncharacterized protein (DUF849 family)
MYYLKRIWLKTRYSSIFRLEDSIWFYAERTCLAANHELVESIRVIARARGRTPYTHKEAREVLGVL